MTSSLSPKLEDARKSSRQKPLRSQACHSSSMPLLQTKISQHGKTCSQTLTQLQVLNAWSTHVRFCRKTVPTTGTLQLNLDSQWPRKLHSSFLMTTSSPVVTTMMYASSVVTDRWPPQAASTSSKRTSAFHPTRYYPKFHLLLLKSKRHCQRKSSQKTTGTPVPSHLP